VSDNIKTIIITKIIIIIIIICKKVEISIILSKIKETLNLKTKQINFTKSVLNDTYNDSIIMIGAL
jgi:hypothetical protein